MATHQFNIVPAPAAVGPRVNLLEAALAGTSQTDPGVSTPPVEQLQDLPADLLAELRSRKGPEWVKGFQYQPENHYFPEARDSCDFATADYAALSAPYGLAVNKIASSGTLTAATHAYVVWAINANGVTTPCTQVTIANSLNDSNVLTWDETADGIQYGIAGRVSGSLGLLAIVGPFPEGTTPTWTDNGSITPGAVPPSTNTTGGPGTYTNLPIVQYVPFLLVAEDFCTTFGYEEHQYVERATRLLDNGTAAGLEREFWSGALAQAKGYPNNYLTNAAAVTNLTPGGGPPSVARGLQILQDALSTSGFGGQGMIHCQPQASPNLLNARRNGAVLYDIFDNLVVPGAGYLATGPGGVAPSAGCAYMYATDLVTVRVDEIQVYPDTLAEATDRGQGGEPNSITFRAERFVAASFDAQVQVCCQVTLAT